MMRPFFVIFCLFSFLGKVEAAIFFPATYPSASGGSGSANITLPNMATSNVTSRTNCVAPCAVYFDAQTTTSGLTSRPFHELLYQWDFGDPVVGAAGTCTDGNPVARDAGQGSYCTGVVTGNPNGAVPLDSKNYAEGSQAAHVFEAPGTYTVTLTASQGPGSDSVFQSSEYKVGTVSITVTNPDTVFASTTRCVNASGTDHTGCPLIPSTHANSAACVTAGDCVTATSASSEITTALAAGDRRILFKRGDTFGFTATTYSTAGPGIIGAYGSGAKPIFSNTGAQIRMHASDWRFVDIRQEMGNTGDATGVYSETTGISNLLLLRVDTRGGQAFQTAGSTISGSTSGIWDGIFIHDSTCKDLQHATGNGDNCYFVSGYRVSIQGNHCDMDSWSEHCIRTYAQRVVISHNTVEDIPSGRAGITNRSFDWAGSGGVPSGTYSGTGVVSLNRDIGNGAGGSIGWGATNNLIDGRCRDVIFERNFTTVAFGLPCATGTTARNNLLRFASGGNLTGINGWMSYASVGSGYPPPTELRIYNNTAYSAGAGDTYGFFIQGTDPEWDQSTWTIWYQNNLINAPGDTSNGDNTYYGTSVTQFTTCASCNTNESGELLSTVFASAPSASSYSSFTPQSGAYTNGRGISTPAFADFLGNWQPATRDIGAVIH